jgi:hypothetical protein
MDLQKIASYGTAAAVVGTGAVVGGGQQLDKYQGGPEKREAEKIELIRTVVAEEVYKQLITAWPKTSGPVKGLKVPNQDYRQTAPPGNGSPR